MIRSATFSADPIWATGAVNDDWSSFSYYGEDEEQAKETFWTWLTWQYGRTAHIVDVESTPHFSRFGDPIRGDRLACNVVTYVVAFED